MAPPCLTTVDKDSGPIPAQSSWLCWIPLGQADAIQITIFETGTMRLAATSSCIVVNILECHALELLEAFGSQSPPSLVQAPELEACSPPQRCI